MLPYIMLKCSYAIATLAFLRAKSAMPPESADVIAISIFIFHYFAAFFAAFATLIFLSSDAFHYSHADAAAISLWR